MGSWGYGPFANDDALDWLNLLEFRVIAFVESELRRFLRRKPVRRRLPAAHDLERLVPGIKFRRRGLYGRLRGQECAFAAAALLNELTRYRPARSLRFRSPRAGAVRTHLTLKHEAERRRAYTLASRAVRELLREELWLTGFLEPSKMRGALRRLLGSLEAKRSHERGDVGLVEPWRRKRRKLAAGWRRRHG